TDCRRDHQTLLAAQHAQRVDFQVFLGNLPPATGRIPLIASPAAFCSRTAFTTATAFAWLAGFLPPATRAGNHWGPGHTGGGSFLAMGPTLAARRARRVFWPLFYLGFDALTPLLRLRLPFVPVVWLGHARPARRLLWWTMRRAGLP